MSTVDNGPATEGGDIQFIVNQTEGTVTAAPANPDGITLPATEWLTVSDDAVVDLQEQR